MSKREDIIHFVEKACGSTGSVTVFRSFADLKNDCIPLILVDASLFFEATLCDSFASHDFSRRIIENGVCILPCNCSKQMSELVEKWFNHIISFPMDIDLFRSCCIKISTKIYASRKKGCQLTDDMINVPESFYGFFCGESTQIKSVRRQLLSASCSDEPVLILGETGTGKTTAARVIHALSNRRKKEMVSVSLSTVVESLAESTFFGHVKGSFTSAESECKGCFEAANESTLFLDELGVAPISVQAMLLSVLETGVFTKVGNDKTQHVNVRLIFATNADLMRMLSEGTFRPDLYYRINDHLIKIPPLRNHKEDIRGMVLNYFDKKSVIISEEAMECLENYHWPGNIRELHKCLKRALKNASQKSMDGIITPEFIDFGDISFPR